MMTTFQALALMIAFGGLIVSIINVSQKRKCDNEKK
ncbi:putative holin-like toxin [Bacillus sp. FSL W7-1360]